MCKAVYIGYIIFHTIVFLFVFFDSLRRIDSKVISNDGGSKLVSSVLLVFLKYFETLCIRIAWSGLCLSYFRVSVFDWWCGIPAECV